MALCPECGKPGALLLFTGVQCPTRKCKNYIGDTKLICPCCGGIEHLETCTNSQDGDNIDPFDPRSDTDDLDASQDAKPPNNYN